MGEAATPRRPAEQGPGAAASRGHIPAGEGTAKLPAQQSASAMAWRSPLGGTSQYYNLPHSQPFFSPRREVLFQHLPLVCKANGPHPPPKVCLCGFHSSWSMLTPAALHGGQHLTEKLLCHFCPAAAELSLQSQRTAHPMSPVTSLEAAGRSRCPAPAPLPTYRRCFASPFTLRRKPQSTARPDFILSAGALLLLC